MITIENEKKIKHSPKYRQKFSEYKHLMKKSRAYKMSFRVLEYLPKKIPFTVCLHLQRFRQGDFIEEILVGGETFV
jgi:hypothetical protein